MDPSLLEAAQRAQEASAAALGQMPTETVTRRSEYVYQHTPGLMPGEPLQASPAPTGTWPCN